MQSNFHRQFFLIQPVLEHQRLKVQNTPAHCDTQVLTITLHDCFVRNIAIFLKLITINNHVFQCMCVFLHQHQ